MHPPADAVQDCRAQDQRECPLARELFVIHHMMMRLGDRLASHYGLTSSRWLLVCAIGRSPEEPTVGQLSEASMLSPQNISRMLAAMEAEGLVERFSRPGAGRTTFVRLTERGQQALGRTRELAERFRSPFLRGFAEPEIERLGQDLGRLVRNLQDFERDLQTEAAAGHVVGRREAP